MSPGRYPGSLARRAPTQRHIHTKAVGSAGKACPRPLALRTGLLLRAVVQFQPLPAFTTSRMPKARKGSIYVTWATLSESITGARVLRDTTPLGGWTAPVPGPGTGREKEWGSFKQASN